MEKAIKIAIEGGWRDAQVLDTDRFASQIPQVMTSDPLFWQALGKAMGWETEERWAGVGFYREGDAPNNPSGGKVGVEKIATPYKWKTMMHRFIDHLVEGRSPDDFFKGLLRK